MLFRSYLYTYGFRESSRAGDVIVSPTPVTTVYHRPIERVLFDQRRDANPFFHLIEAVWMLAGRRDATFLDRYVRDFSSRFAEDDGDAHGAYGARWRCHFPNPHHTGHEDSNAPALLDQLLEVGQMLYDDPTSRRVVLSMWDPLADLGASKADLPCNTHVYFRGNPRTETLDVTVCNRSNDIVWGAYGANAVHMSVMAEVVAGLAGLRLGAYYQISNNYHAYTSVFDKLSSVPVSYDDRYTKIRARPILDMNLSGQVRSRWAKRFLDDCVNFCVYMGHADDSWARTSWMREVVIPVERTHRLWRTGDREGAIEMSKTILADDWRIACQEWMSRRMVG